MKNNGFTLIEIIVVLVILAVLAAFSIPAMTGFISDAKNKKDVNTATELYLACQVVATSNTPFVDGILIPSNEASATDHQKELAKLLTGDIVVGTDNAQCTIRNSKVEKVYFKKTTSAKGIIIDYVRNETTFS